jgi:hypothetical protein
MIKLILTRTGEQIISGIKDYLDEEGKPVCYVLISPYVLTLIPSEEVDDNEQPVSFKINYKKWMPCSNDIEYKVPYDFIATIATPDDQILQSFLSRFGDILNDNDAVQPSDSSDTAEDAGVSDSGD